MHFKSQGSLNYGGVDEVERDAPSRADSDDGAEQFDFHEVLYIADSESSDNDDELPYNVEAFLNPVYDIEDLNIEDPDDIIDNDTNTGEEGEEQFEGIFNDFNFVDQEGSSSSSEMSDDYEENEWEIIEPNNEQQDASNNPERANLSSNQQGTSHNSDNEDLNNVQQGALSNQEISTTNDIEKANLNSTRQGEPYNSDTEELNKAQQGASSNQEISTTNDIERANLNSTQSELFNSDKEDLNNAQQGASSNQEISTTNDIERANLNSTQSELFNSDKEDLNNAQQGASSNQEISTTNDIERANLNSTQSELFNSDKEDLNNIQQGASSNQEISTTNDIERANLNSTQSELFNSDNEDLNNAQQGASSNQEISTTNDINPNLFNDDSCIFVTCDDECIEPIAISTPSFGTSYSPNIYYCPHNSDFETPESPASVNLNEFNYHGPSNSGYPSLYPPNNGARGDAGNMQTSGTPGSVDYETTQSSENTSGPPVSNATFSSQHHASGNPGYATLHLLPRDTLLHNPGYPTSHYHLIPAGRCYPGPYSPIFSTTNNRSYRNLYSTNHNAPDYPGFTGPRLANYSAPNNHGYVAPTPRNDPTSNNPPRNNTSCRTQQESGYDASDNLASGTTPSTNYIAPGASADGPAEVSAYEAPNAPGYGTSTSFDQSDQHSPGQGTSVPLAYLGPDTYDYGNPYSPNYIAPDSSSGATHYSQFNAPSSGYPTPECPDTLGISENVVSQSPVTQVLSNDEASGSTASYNYSGPSTSGYGVPVRNEPTRDNASYYGNPYSFSGCPDTLDVSENVTSQSPVTQVLSNDEASGSTASYNYSGPSTSGYGVPVRNEPSRDNASYYGNPYSSSGCPDTLDVSDNVTSQSPVTQVLSNDEASGSTASYNSSGPSTSGYGVPVRNEPTRDNASYYGNPYSSSGCPDTLDVSENVTSQSPVTQELSNDEASGSRASYNYSGASTSGYGVPVRNEPTRDNASYRTPQATDGSNNLAPVTTGYGRPGWFFFNVYSGPDSISYNSPNGPGYDASGMSRDAELGPSGGQRGRRHPFNSRSLSRSLPNSTRRHGRDRGDKHGQ